MNDHLKSYAWFVGFLVLTKLIVKPMAEQFNVPMLKDVL
mgnify:FL=1